MTTLPLSLLLHGIEDFGGCPSLLSSSLSISSRLVFLLDASRTDESTDSDDNNGNEDDHQRMALAAISDNPLSN
jgi:hypothetical protein